MQITPLAHFREGTPIRLTEGFLFTTHATLRSGEREGKVDGCSLQTFQEATGLEIAGSDGTLREGLPPIHLP
ncbi:MAG: hypothetical protein R3F54_30000 [Alphaproteobacteria bacterium]